MGLASFLEDAPTVFVAAILLRIGMLLYGQWQDQVSAFKYTDIDYYVFTDAARFVARGLSPYIRDTYRYTPLLAWLLVPTSWGGAWFAFGKALFAFGDIVTGALIVLTLRRSHRMSTGRATKYATLWLLNPMVATISTRGSSEGLLAVLVMALLWSCLHNRIVLAGFLLGLGVHFKIYPFIYAVSIVWWLDSATISSYKSTLPVRTLMQTLVSQFTPARLTLAVSSLVTFFALNGVMYSMYGHEFLQHTFLYHFVRTDHRHNFSPYNMMLYQNSSPLGDSNSHPETFAFLPQLVLSAVALPLVMAPKDLPATMLAQTFAFVTFNKVCTSQYFLWYMVFLPFYLPDSTLLRQPRLGAAALVAWVAGQALWLQQGYQLEFLGYSTFLSGLWPSSLIFFVVNLALLGVIITDVRGRRLPISQ